MTGRSTLNRLECGCALIGYLAFFAGGCHSLSNWSHGLTCQFSHSFRCLCSAGYRSST
jgi:hypothetical protein